jgi:exopolyphosphatase/guanosine-5'-triphosphate,3'-diphosphate pyrophosphatase
MRKAVIDLGTNSLKLLIARVEGSEVEILQDVSLISRLGRDLATTGRIGEQGMQWNLEALRRFKGTCSEHGVDSILCVGAKTLRSATDAGEFTALVLKETGIEVRTLSERQEAQLAWEAARSLAESEDVKVLVFDTGGGSTEFSLGSGPEPVIQKGLPLGALVLTERFVRHDPPTDEEFQALDRYVFSSLGAAFPSAEKVPTIGCGGTLTTMAAVAMAQESYDQVRVHGFHLGRGEIARQVEVYRSLNLERKRNLKGLHPGRADIILAGAVIARNIVKVFDLGGITVSALGIRHALLRH